LQLFKQKDHRRTLNMMPLNFKFQMAGNFIPKYCDVAETRFQQLAARWSDSGNLQKFQPFRPKIPARLSDSGWNQDSGLR
jgi:hypothetical protein